MGKRIAGLVAVCLMVATILVMSCAPAPAQTPAPTPTPIPSPTPTPKPTPTPGYEVPRYGGVFIGAFPRASDGLDCALVGSTHSYPLHLTNETLSIGDWTKGPAGTNEFDFTQHIHLEEYTTGDLAESWEVPDANTVIFHIRKGVHFSLNPESEASRLVNGREMTAQDVAFCIERKFSPENYFGKARPGWFKSATAVDKWTVVVKAAEVTKEQTSMMLTYLIGFLNIYPPEVIQKYGNMMDWKNSVGTGPYMLTDLVPSSSYTFVRNPNYWAKDPVGPGKGNQLPYLDGVLWLDIRDKSTRIAALRTARVDHVGTLAESNLVWEDAKSLLKTNPELKSYGYTPSTTVICMRVDKPELPFYDVRVRRALHMAINFKAIKDEYYDGEAEILTVPMPSFFKGSYTPLEQLPPNIKELFEYHPDKAKQLLAEAGYPKGFKTSIVTTPDLTDLLSIVVNYWEGIGVKLELDVKESGIWTSIRNARSHKEMITGSGSPQVSGQNWTNTNPTDYVNCSMINDPWINERVAQKWAFENMGNIALRDQLDKEYSLHVLDRAYYIQLPAPSLYNMWQPWVKNYHGETEIGVTKRWSWLYYTWLDQELKQQMTGRR